MVINESPNRLFPGIQRSERNYERILGNQTLKYNISGTPNSIYQIGVQAYTCAGPGHISWRNGTCVTDFEGSIYADFL